MSRIPNKIKNFDDDLSPEDIIEAIMDDSDIPDDELAGEREESLEQYLERVSDRKRSRKK